MSFLSIIYIVLITISFAFAFVHLGIWIRLKSKLSYLLFMIVALSSAFLALIELNIINLRDEQQYTWLVKLYHLPLYTYLVSLVWFVFLYFKTANKYLAITFTSLWTICLGINFAVEGNLAFHNIIELQVRYAFNGEAYVHPVTNSNPLRLIADIASVVYLIYMVLATKKLYETGERTRALLVGGSSIMFILISGIIAPLSDLSIIKIPPTISLPFVFILIAISFELIEDIIKANELSGKLLSHERKWDNLLKEVGVPVVGVDLMGKVNYVNPSMLRITGCEEEEVIGENWLEKFIPEKDKGKILKEFKLPLKEGFPAVFQNNILTRKSEERILMWSNVGVYDENEVLSGITAIGTDITDRELAYKEILALKEQLELENKILKEQNRDSTNPDEIVSQSAAVTYAIDKARQVAEVDSTVLLEGETGVGKGVFAKFIHTNSSRNKMPFVTVNCAAIPSNLLESELFGYEKGAFTGAIRRKKGRFELADGGTLFLDEIGELPIDIQPKLLRVLQDNCFERLGGEQTIKANVRVIAATNKQLGILAKREQFRQDLFYRLNVFPITIPPLRKRLEDVPHLVDHFVGLYSKKYNRKITKVSKQTYTSFIKYNWPGNIRELQNMIERAVISARGNILKTNGLLPAAKDNNTSSNGVVATLEVVERNHIINVLTECGWQVHGENGAAVILGINPSTLRSRMKKLGIEKGEQVSI